MEHALGLFAAGLLLASLVSRLVETWRSSSVSGLSTGFLWLCLLLNAGWAAYGLFGDVPAQLYPSLLALFVFGYSLLRVHRSGRSQYRAAFFGLAGVVLLVGIAFSSPDTVGYLAGAIGVAAVVPQLVQLGRTGDTAGIAPRAWAIGLLMSLSWAVYGLVAGLTPVWTSNVASAVLTSVLLTMFFRAGRAPAGAPVVVANC